RSDGTSRPPRFLGSPRAHAPLYDPGGTPPPGHLGDTVLPSVLATTSAPTTKRFRGSITQPIHSLSTLRRPGHPGTTQDSLPAGGQPCRAGFSPAGLQSEVSSCSAT